MISWPLFTRSGPLGIDIGTKSIKAVQLSADRSRVVAAHRLELSAAATEQTGEQRQATISDALATLVKQHGLKGCDAVCCLDDQQMFLQNIRIAKNPAETERLVAQEIAGRLPFSVEEAEIRYVESADVRQGETIVREVIVMACKRTHIHAQAQLLESVGLRPVSIDTQPCALARGHSRQFRRDVDKSERALLVHLGHRRSLAVVAHGDEVLFVKYIDIGGTHFDQALARQLRMELPEATRLRRREGDRRADRQDSDVVRAVQEALRAPVDRLCGELGLCTRYHSVMFRGQSLSRVVVSGGEATPELAETIGKYLSLETEVCDPVRHLDQGTFRFFRKCQWDLAVGLALRNVE
ncbi:MAG: pilus assembly protein PilM [Pirellulales bacterium]